MKVLILWRSRGQKNFVYKGVVGGAMWENHIMNARNGYGECILVDATDVKDAKAKQGLATPSKIPNVFVHGEKAKGYIR